MQTKNKAMEFTSDHLKQKVMVELRNVLLKCKEFQAKLESVTNERTECLAEHEKTMEHLNSLQAELEIVKKEEFNWRQKLEKVKTSFAEDTNDYLQYICLCLGFQISKCLVSENSTLLITLNYRDICFVTYSETIEGLYDVLDIHPPHTNFVEIQQYLHETQDLRGLLACLRKFFDYAIEIKEKDMRK